MPSKVKLTSAKGQGFGMKASVGTVRSNQKVAIANKFDCSFPGPSTTSGQKAPSKPSVPSVGHNSDAQNK